MTDPLSIPASRWIKTRKPYQKHRLQYWTPANTVRGPDGRVFTDSRGQYGQDLGFSDDLAPRHVNHRGWFADNWQSDVIRGSVCRIRGARFTLYVPVIGCSGWDGTIHHMADAERAPRGPSEEEHAEAIRNAAVRADRLAELEAEEARDHATKDQAEQAIESERETIAAERARVHTLAAELRNTPALPPAIYDTITQSIREAREQVRASVKRIRLLTDGPWQVTQ